MMKPAKSRTARQFGRRADAYTTSRAHAAGPDLDILVRLLEARPTDIVLDIATGPGHTAFAIAPHVREVVATDLTPEMIAKARARIDSRGITNVRALVMDAESLDFPDAAFDAVACRIAPHHFADVERALAEIARVLKPGGRFVLEDSCAPDDPEADRFLNEIEVLRDPTHVRSYTLTKWRAMLRNVRLRIVHEELYRKEHAIEEWLERAATPPAVRDSIRGKLLDAPETLHSTFDILIEEGRPIRFTDEKLILRADRPESL